MLIIYLGDNVFHILFFILNSTRAEIFHGAILPDITDLSLGV